MDIVLFDFQCHVLMLYDIQGVAKKMTQHLKCDNSATL